MDVELFTVRMRADNDQRGNVRALRESETLDGRALRAWIRDQRRQNLADGTIAKRESVARRVVAFTGRPLLDLSREDIEAWLDSRPRNTARTRYSDISHLAAFYRWAILEELTEHDPTARIIRPKVRVGLPRPVASLDLRYALDQASDPELNAMLHLAAFGGLRCAEISGLDATDVLGTHEPPVLLVHGKGGKQRLVPLHPDVATALHRWVRVWRGPLFPTRPAWKVSQMMREHLLACGISASGHQLRHWFATATYNESGGDLRLVQDLLGHSSPSTTAIYTKLSRGKAMKVVAKLTA